MTVDHSPREFSPTPVRVPWGDHWLHGDLGVPPSAKGMVAFAHGSGSSRLSPRNKYVARVLDRAGLGTLLIDLLTPEEEAISPARRSRARGAQVLAPSLTERRPATVVSAKLSD